MKTIFLIFLGFLTITASTSSDPLSKEFATRASAFPVRAFIQWTGFNTKSYQTPEERSYRFNIWQENLRVVNNFNAQNNSYWLAMTRFADLTEAEMRSHTGIERCTNVTDAEKSILSHRMAPTPLNLQGGPPASVDWRTKGFVTEAKEQGNCGSCWAFSVVAAVETAYAVKTGTLTSFSEQQIVDCCVGIENTCKGNTLSNGYSTIIQQGGVVPDSVYPYVSGVTGISETCKTDSVNKDTRAKIENFLGVAPNEAAIENAVVTQPLAAIVATGAMPGWLLYGGGVYSGECGPKPDHGVTIVGYGEDDGQKYWLIKNSWGKKWGEAGFMKLLRSPTPAGQCGINQYPSRPLMAGFNVADYPQNTAVTSGVKMYPKKAWKKRILTLALSACADACQQEAKCQYFSRLGCNKVYDDKTNCELTDMEGVLNDPVVCGDSGALPTKPSVGPGVTTKPIAPPPAPIKRPPPKIKKPTPKPTPKPSPKPSPKPKPKR